VLANFPTQIAALADLNSVCPRNGVSRLSIDFLTSICSRAWSLFQR